MRKKRATRSHAGTLVSRRSQAGQSMAGSTWPRRWSRCSASTSRAMKVRQLPAATLYVTKSSVAATNSAVLYVATAMTPSEPTSWYWFATTTLSLNSGMSGSVKFPGDDIWTWALLSRPARRRRRRRGGARGRSGSRWGLCFLCRIPGRAAPLGALTHHKVAPTAHSPSRARLGAASASASTWWRSACTAAMTRPTSWSKSACRGPP